MLTPPEIMKWFNEFFAENGRESVFTMVPETLPMSFMGWLEKNHGVTYESRADITEMANVLVANGKIDASLIPKLTMYCKS